LLTKEPSLSHSIVSFSFCHFPSFNMQVEQVCYLEKMTAYGTCLFVYMENHIAAQEICGGFCNNRRCAALWWGSFLIGNGL
jgi:hypothetical protein